MLSLCSMLVVMAVAPGVGRTASVSGRPAEVEESLPEISLTPNERVEVLDGGVILREIPDAGRKGKTFEAVGLLPGTLKEAFAVITDYGCYPEFMPRLAKMNIEEPDKDRSVVECTLNVPIIKDKRYRLLYAAAEAGDGFRVTWEKLPWPELSPSETIADTRGYWLVRAFDGGRICALYHVYTDPGKVPFGLSGLANSLSKSGLRDVILKTRERIRALYYEGKEERG